MNERDKKNTNKSQIHVHEKDQSPGNAKNIGIVDFNRRCFRFKRTYEFCVCYVYGCICVYISHFPK